MRTQVPQTGQNKRHCFEAHKIWGPLEQKELNLLSTRRGECLRAGGVDGDACLILYSPGAMITTDEFSDRLLVPTYLHYFSFNLRMPWEILQLNFTFFPKKPETLKSNLIYFNFFPYSYFQILNEFKSKNLIYIYFFSI